MTDPTHECSICGAQFGGKPHEDVPQGMEGFTAAIRHVKEKHPTISLVVGSIRGCRTAAERKANERAVTA